MICKDCQSKSIKSRTNYPHGTKSRSITSFTCRNCGSRNVSKEERKFSGRRRR